MKTFSKIIITFGVLGLFVIIIAALIGALMSGFEMPGIMGGEIRVIPIHGDITLGGCPASLFYASSCAEVNTIKEQLKEADNDMQVKAIVLDVYSGGGNVVASRELMRAVKKTEKPTVAWIGEVGASGAYYVASAADKIIADETSITGSIGVIMPITHYYGLMDKIGVNVTVLKSGESKDIGSPFRPMQEQEKAKLQSMMDTVYDTFTKDVAENRGLDHDYVKNISQGEIYLGEKAYEIGLIDELGGFDEAIEIAAKMGGITGEPTVTRPEREIKLIDLL